MQRPPCERIAPARHEVPRLASLVLALACAAGLVFPLARAQEADSVLIPAVVSDGVPSRQVIRPDLDPRRAYTIYLTGDRVCKHCYWRAEAPGVVTLCNARNVCGTYPLTAIQGVDRHPVWRRVVGKGIRGTGLAGRTIVPQAFDDEAYLDYP